MLLGRVVGTVVASRKEDRLVGAKLLVVRNLDVEGADANGYAVAVDAVGAGVGEVVMVATGSSARQTAVTHERPCDAVVMAIVDEWELDGRQVWSKSLVRQRKAGTAKPGAAAPRTPAAGNAKGGGSTPARPAARPPRRKG
jgi:microcompartment protein CcmK/EutM